MIYSDITSRALIFLQKRPGLHTDMTEAIYRGQAEILYAEGDGVLQLVRGEKTGAPVLYQLSADTPETAERVLNRMEHSLPVVTHQSCATEIAARRGGRVSIWTQAYWPTFEPPRAHSSVEIWPLDLGDLPVVAEHYHLIRDPEELAERITSRNMYGACVDDRVAGFIGLHAEGAIGMLTVLEPYRGRGIGAALLTDLIRRELRRGHIPYSHILRGNEASHRLQRRVGMTFHPEPVWWVMPAEGAKKIAGESRTAYNKST